MSLNHILKQNSDNPKDWVQLSVNSIEAVETNLSSSSNDTLDIVSGTFNPATIITFMKNQSGSDQTITLGNLPTGQIITLIYEDQGAAEKIIITNIVGYTTVEFNAEGDSAQFVHNIASGWYMIGSSVGLTTT